MRNFTKPQLKTNRDPGQEQAELAFIALPRPLDLEIGCGVGLHPIQRCQLHPERGLVAIEHTREKFERFWGRYLNHKQPSNLLPLHRNAIGWLSDMNLNERFENIFLFYPNPNPKRKNQRWLCMPFFQVMKDSLLPGGRVHLATNIEAYALEAKEMGQNVWKLNIQEFSRYTGNPRTHFEKKYLERGESCFQVVFQKSETESK